MNNNVRELLTIVCARIAAGQTEFNGRYLFVRNFDRNTFDRVQQLLIILQITVDGDQQELEFDLNRNLGDIFVFFGKRHFLAENSYDRYKEDFENNIIVVLLEDGTMLSKSPDDVFGPLNALIYNYIHYRNILSVMLSNTQFVSVSSVTDRQVIILSTKHGPYNIGYKLSEERVEGVADLSEAYDDLVKNFNKIEYINFFKDVVISGTHSQQQVAEVFWDIVSSLRTLLNLADRDYQIYAHTFAFDKIKSKFKEEKVKYFESLEKNIESLNKQVLAFPLTFAASAFAGYQVKDNGWILIVILAAYSLYTIVALAILNITKLNINTTKEDVEKESNNISKKYKFVYDEFKPDFDIIYKKIRKINRLHTLLQIVLWALLALFVLFCIVYGKNLKNNTVATEQRKEDSLRHLKDSLKIHVLTDSISKLQSPLPEVVMDKHRSRPKRNR